MRIKRYKKNSGRVLPQIFSVLKRVYQFDKKLLFVFILNVFVTAAAPFPFIIFSKYIIDALTLGENFRKVVLFSGIMFGANYLLTNMGGMLASYKSVFSARMSIELANNVRKKCLDMDYEMFNNAAMQERATLALSLSANNNFVGLLDGIGRLVSNGIILAAVIMIVIRLDLRLIILAVVAVSVQCILYFRNSKNNMGIDQDSAITNRCIRFFEPLFMKPQIKKDITVYHMGEYLLNKYNTFLDMWMDIFIRRTRLNCVYEALNTAVSFLYQMTAYLLLGARVFSKSITVGSFTMGINSLNSFMSATNGIVRSIIDVSSKITFISKYDNFLRIPNLCDKYTKYNFDGVNFSNIEIVFENVSFKYPGSTDFIFRNLNLKIKGDEKIAIVGENGAGKTTFVLLLTRMYTPVEGRILINGRDIREYDRESYMRLFSVVHQDFLLLPFSIYENIVFQEEEDEGTREKVVSLLAQCGLRDRVDSMYQGLMTPVSKEIDARGVDLSGGEMQKIAIARALFKDAPIVILDEPTSALDPAAEYEIYSHFAEMTHHKTAFYISHRIASTRFCTRILVFDKGSVAEEGTFEELIVRQGLYYDFYQKQAQYFSGQGGEG